MKLALIGAGVRTPFLVRGLIARRDRLPVDEVALYDVDAPRLAVMAGFCEWLAKRAGAGFSVMAEGDLDAALAGADFVFAAIRVGRDHGRVVDERVALDHGVVGQETTGPGGFAMALRTIPAMLELCRAIERRCPDAHLVNFTNPAGLITQAVHVHSNVKVVGVCDTPTSMKRSIARALGVPGDAVFLDYFGLNHLGWARRVLVDGTDRLPFLLDHYDLLQRAGHGWTLFDPALVRALGMLANEYLYYFYYRERALAHISASGGTRARQIEDLNTRLWRDLADCVEGKDYEGALRAYSGAMATRHGTYMARESGGDLLVEPGAEGDLFEGEGYEGLAMAVMSGVAQGSRRALILDVPNRGAIAGLEADDVVEVPCMMDPAGPLPLAVGAIPEGAAALVHAVKVYERATIAAAVRGSTELAVSALAAHPLVGSHTLARAMVQDYRRLHPELSYLSRAA